MLVTPSMEWTVQAKTNQATGNLLLQPLNNKPHFCSRCWDGNGFGIQARATGGYHERRPYGIYW